MKREGVTNERARHNDYHLLLPLAMHGIYIYTPRSKLYENDLLFCFIDANLRSATARKKIISPFPLPFLISRGPSRLLVVRARINLRTQWRLSLFLSPSQFQRLRGPFRVNSVQPKRKREGGGGGGHSRPSKLVIS